VVHGPDLIQQAFNDLLIDADGPFEVFDTEARATLVERLAEPSKFFGGHGNFEISIIKFCDTHYFTIGSMSIIDVAVLPRRPEYSRLLRRGRIDNDKGVRRGLIEYGLPIWGYLSAFRLRNTLRQRLQFHLTADLGKFALLDDVLVVGMLSRCSSIILDRAIERVLHVVDVNAARAPTRGRDERGQYRV